MYRKREYLQSSDATNRIKDESTRSYSESAARQTATHRGRNIKIGSLLLRWQLPLGSRASRVNRHVTCPSHKSSWYTARGRYCESPTLLRVDQNSSLIIILQSSANVACLDR
jgi:hypothetical protein